MKSYSTFYMLLFHCISDVQLLWDPINEFKVLSIIPYNKDNPTNVHINDIIMKYHDFITRSLLCYSLKKTYSLKFKRLFKIINDQNIDKDVKYNVIKVFGIAQKRYLALCKFAYICKYKRADVTVNYDLINYEKLDKNKNNTVVYFHENKLYYFSVLDLMNIIHNALYRAIDGTFVPCPCAPLNPYTKTPFTKSHLYNLYFHIRYKTGMSISTTFHLWYKENFAIDLFKCKNEKYLRKCCIRKYTWSTCNTDEVIIEDVMDLIGTNDSTKKWNIHKDFPRKQIVDNMRHYLYLYYLIHYEALDELLESVYTDLLMKELDHCYKNNKNYGSIVNGFDEKEWDFSSFPLNNVFNNEFYSTFSSKTY